MRSRAMHARGVLRRTALALWVVALGCSASCESEPEAAAEPGGENAAPGEAKGPAPAQPRANDENATSAPTTAAHGPPAPTLGCRVDSVIELGQNLGAARLAVAPEGIWVASYARRDGKRSLARFLVSREGAVRALPLLPLGEAGEGVPKVAPAIHRGRSLWVAGFDALGALSLWPAADADAPEARALAPRVDPRFTPALHELGPGRALVAYTEGDATGMRVQAVVVGEDALTRHALTPLGHGASAPRFALGSDALSLVMIDARSGMSPLLRVPFDARGEPGEAVVERPVNLPYSPPELVAVQVPGSKPHVAYTAVGNGATAAVGLVPLGATDPPVALLRGTGYALLSVDATLGPAHAVFAVDAPQHAEPKPPLDVQVRVWDGTQLGEPLRLEARGQSRMRPALAYDAVSSLVWLVSVRDTALELHRLRCDV